MVSEWQRAQYCVTFTPYVYIVLCTCKIYLHWQSVYPQYKKHNQHYKLIWSRSKTNKTNAHKIWKWTRRQSKCPMSTSCIVINLWRQWTDIYILLQFRMNIENVWAIFYGKYVHNMYNYRIRNCLEFFLHVYIRWLIMENKRRATARILILCTNACP